jgi:tripartite ATP-independent transporter DctM subunit
MIAFLFVILFGLIALGMNIWLAMGLSGVAYILIEGEISLRMVASTMVGGVDSSTLVAIPLFILAGELMNKSGITIKLTELADYFLGRVRGGLAYVAVVVNLIVAGVSGSAVADASAVSSVVVPTMVKRGYGKAFAASINGAAAVLGPIIPPSIPMIFIGIISGISVGKLFLGGVVPGLLMGAVLMAAIFVISKRRNYPVSETEMSIDALKLLLRDSFFALMAPVIILGGLILGFVTLVEVSVLAVLYILIISLFVYRSIRIQELPGIFYNSAVFSSSVMIIFAVVGLYQYIIAYEQLGDQLGALIRTWDMSPFLFLLSTNVLLLILGCIIDAVPVMLIFFPVLLPIAIELGIDPTHFGVIVVLNLMIGLLTPPIGVLLFLECKIAEVGFGELLKEIWPFVLALLGVLILCTYVPALVTWLPNLVFGG